MADRQWRNWTMGEWNEVLFHHFFLDSECDNRPVQRIPVTGDELIKVVRDPDATADDVQGAFLAVLRTPSHIEFNHRVSQYPTDLRVGWVGPGIPPFFVELAFSCLVASPPDGEIRAEGDFRKRLALLMEHNRVVARYPLGNLPHLWEAFSHWLDAKRATGSPYRRLELPPLDYRVRIGYSINLAFPSRKDMENLIRVLSVGGLTVDPSIPTVFALVGEEIETFSHGFIKAYDDFRAAYRDRRTDLAQYPFWGAIREALDDLEETRPEDEKDKAALLLAMEPGGVVLLLSDSPREVGQGELSFVGAETPFGEFQNVLCVGQDIGRGIQDATHKLLRGPSRYHLTGKGWFSIRLAIEQGVLFFAKTDRLTWELVFSLHEEGDLLALVKDSLVPVLLSAFHEDRRPHRRPSRYSGWTELDRFPGVWLASLQFDELSPLTEIRCLQQTFRRQRLSIVGGCPIDGGYLGIPGCLPSIRAPHFTKVELVPLEPKYGGSSIHLAKHSPDSADFEFPGNIERPLDGRFRIVGSRGERVLVRKEVVFRPDIVVNNYARPTNPDAWLVEAGGPDVVTFGESSSQEQASKDRPGARRKFGGKVSAPYGSNASPTPRTEVRDLDRFHDPLVPGFRIHMVSKDLDAASRLMEICGGLSMRRKGIPEAEFLEFLQATTTVDHHRTWDVVRAWLEAGYLDRLASRKWHRTEYFSRIPQFVLDRDGSQVRGVLSGLATSVLRNRADVELLKRGATRVETLSFSEWVPPIPTWRTPDASAFEEVARTLDLDEPTWLRPIADVLWSLPEVASGKDDPPRFHDCWGIWNWKNGRFAKDAKPTGQGIEVSRFLHIQRPPFYQVSADGEQVWWSTSRNWALLLAHDLRGVPCFALSGADQLVRSTRGQVYLPLPVGRYLAIACSVAPGPVSDRPGMYCYQFPGFSERSRLIASIWSTTAVQVEELRRWGKWMIGLSRRQPSGFYCRAIPVPKYIREELGRFPGVPEFQDLSRTRLDPALLPRLRQGLSRFTKARRS